MAVFKRGEIYHCTIYNRITGETKWESLRTSDEEIALRLYADKLKESKNRSENKTTSVAWETFKQKYLREAGADKAPDTVVRDRYRLSTFERLTEIRESIQFTPQLLFEYKTSRRLEGAEKATINRELGMLKKMGELGKNYTYIDKAHDFKSVERYKKWELPARARRFFELEEIKTIWKKIQQTGSKLLEIGLAVAWYTGMRPEEIRQLRWKDIDFKNNLIHVVFKGSWRTKDMQERTITLFKPLKAILLTYKPLSRSEYVVMRDDGARPGKDFLARKFKEFLVENKIEGRLYAGRHTFATHALGKHDIKMVSSMLGHASLETTGIYVHLREDALKKAANTPPF